MAKSYFAPYDFDFVNVTAHARLMFRNEVTCLDAITAILCIESSMTTSAIVDSVGNALHSNFTEKPDLECILPISNIYLCIFLTFTFFQVMLDKFSLYDFLLDNW